MGGGKVFKFTQNHGLCLHQFGVKSAVKSNDFAFILKWQNTGKVVVVYFPSGNQDRSLLRFYSSTQTLFSTRPKKWRQTGLFCQGVSGDPSGSMTQKSRVKSLELFGLVWVGQSFPLTIFHLFLLRRTDIQHRGKHFPAATTETVLKVNLQSVWHKQHFVRDGQK